MSKTVDERVVSMRFDNENFEKNAQQSLSTLEKLKNALSFKGASDGLKNVDAAAKSVNMSGLESGVKAVEARFSALQVIGVTALARITNQAMAAGEQLIKSLSTDQITAGWTKYAEKTTAVQTIMAATASAFSDTETQMAAVNSQLEKLSWFTDETSYNFVDMVSNIGKFTSNNIGLEESVTAMQGIANWAAISGANATEASRAMYNLSQAIGVGAVTAVDWRSIENANMATAEFKQTAIETAAALGTLKKTGDGLYETFEGDSVTVANFRENLNQKWFNNEVLTQTLDKYGAFTNKLNAAYEETGKLTSDLLNDIEAYKDGTLDIDQAIKDTGITAERYGQIMAELGDKSMEFGMKTFKAAQETKTFAEVIDYTKDAVSSNWMNIFESIFGDYTNAKKFWTGMSEDFYTLFVQPLEELGEVVEDAFGSKWTTLTDKITKAGISVDAFESSIRDVAGTRYVDQMIEKYGSLEQAISAGAFARHNILQKALERIIGPAKAAEETVEQVTQSVVNLEDVVKRVIRGDFGNGQARVEALTKAGYDYYVVQDMVNKTIWGQAVNYEYLSEAQLKANGYTEEQIAQMKELVDENGQLNEEMLELLGLVQKKSGRELFTESIQNGLQIIIKSIGILRESWNNVFNRDRASMIYNMLDKVHSFSENVLGGLDKNADKITRTFTGLFNALNLITRVIKAPFKLAAKAINKVLAKFDLNIWDITAAIGDWITKLRNWIDENDTMSKVLSKVIEYAVKFGTVVFETGKKIASSDKVRSALKKLFDLAKVGFEYMKKMLGSVSEKIKEFIERWKGVDHIDLETIKAMLKDLKENFIDPLFDFSDADKKLQDFGGKLRGFFSNVTSFAGLSINPEQMPFVSKIVEIFKKIGEYVSTKVGFGSILTAAIAGAEIYSVKHIVKALGSLTSSIANIGVSISNLVASISGLFQSVTGVLKSVSGLLTAYTKSIQYKNVLNIALAIGILVASIVALALLDVKYARNLDHAVQIVAELAAVLGFLTLMTGVMNKLSAGSSFSTSMSLIAMAASLFLVVKTLQEIEKLDPERVLSTALIALGLMIELLIVAGLAGRYVEGKDALGIISILAMAVALKIVVSTVSEIAALANTINWTQWAEGMLLVFTTLGLLMVMSHAFTKNAKAGIGMFAAVAALYAMTKVIQAISELDVDSLRSNIKAFIVVFGMFGVLMIMSKAAGEHAEKGGSAILKMSIALALIVVSIKILAGMDKAALDQALSAVIQLMVCMGAIVMASYFAGQHAIKAGAMLLLMGVTIGILAGVIALLAYIAKENPDGIDRAKNIILSIGAVFTAMIWASSKIGKDNKAIANLVALTVLIAVLALSIAALSNIPEDKLASATTALVSLMLAFTFLELASSVIGESSGAWKSIAAIALIVVGLAGILYAMDQLNVGSAMENAKALSIMLLAFSAAMFILAQIGPKAVLAEQAAVSLGKVVLAIGIVVTALGALANEFPQIQNALESGIPLVAKIGEAIGSFIGGIVSGGLVEMSESLGTVCDNLNSALSKIDNNTINGMKALADMMVSFGKAELKDAFSNFIGGLIGSDDMTTFADKVTSFADVLNNFPDVDKDKISSAKNAAAAGKALAEFAAAIPNEGGALAWLIGDNNDLSKFGESVKGFADQLSDFPSIDAAQIENAKNVGEAGRVLADFAAAMPNEGGKLAEWVGDNNNLGEFGKQAKLFANQLIDMPTLTDAHIESARMAAEAAQHIISFASKVSNSGGSLAETYGDNDQLGEFGRQARLFAEQLYAMPILTQDHVGTAAIIASAIDSMVSIASSLGQNKTLFGQIIEDDTLTNLLGSLENTLPKFVELDSALSGIDFSSISNNVQVLITTLRQLVDTIHSITGDESVALSSVTDSFRTFAQNGVAALADGFSANPQVVVSAVNGVLNSCIKAVAEYKDNFKIAGDALTNNLKTGVANYSISKLSGAFASKLSTTVATIRATYYTPFYNVGVYLVEGFAKGISDNINKAATAASKMASEAEKAAKAELEQNSPSKKFIKIGEGTGEGFILGMENYQSAVAMAGADLAAASLTDVATTLSAVNDIVNSNLDLEPTITPVIDSSSLAYGMDSINSMFSDTKASVLSADISGRIDANSIVLDYIDKLDKANSDRNNVLTRSLDSVRNEIGRLGDRIDQIDMVLDSGELVGAIGSKVDRDLGRRTKFKNRGM